MLELEQQTTLDTMVQMLMVLRDNHCITLKVVRDGDKEDLIVDRDSDTDTGMNPEEIFIRYYQNARWLRPE